MLDNTPLRLIKARRGRGRPRRANQAVGGQRGSVHLVLHSSRQYRQSLAMTRQAGYIEPLADELGKLTAAPFTGVR